MLRLFLCVPKGVVINWGDIGNVAAICSIVSAIVSIVTLLKNIKIRKELVSRRKITLMSELTTKLEDVLCIINGKFLNGKPIGTHIGDAISKCRELLPKMKLLNKELAEKKQNDVLSVGEFEKNINKLEIETEKNKQKKLLQSLYSQMAGQKATIDDLIGKLSV